MVQCTLNDKLCFHIYYFHRLLKIGKFRAISTVIEVGRGYGLYENEIFKRDHIFILCIFGDTVVAHQDSTFLYTEPDTLVGFWIALDDATLENGCLWIVPGSHKTGVYKRFIRNPEKRSDNQTVFQGTLPDYEQSLYVPVAVEKCIIKIMSTLIS